MSDPSTLPRASLVMPLLQQVLFTVLSALLTDGGNVATAGLCVSAAFWVGAFTICLRRPRDELTRSDRLYLGFGLPLAWIVGVPLFHLVWARKNLITF